MNKHIPKIFKGIGIAFALTLVLTVTTYLLVEILVYGDRYSVSKIFWSEDWRALLPFSCLWIIHSCYCIMYEFVPPSNRAKQNHVCLWIVPLAFLVAILLPLEKHWLTRVFTHLVLSIPCVIVLRGIWERLILKYGYKDIIFNWKVMYAVWFIYLIVVGLARNKWTVTFSVVEMLFVIKAIGCVLLTVVGCYWLWRKQWLNSIMFFIPICFKMLISLIYKL